jgi:hypothetical protein
MKPMTPDQAQHLQQLLIECSPLIEEYTAAVCPGCADVCCRQKHGKHCERDLAYLRALGTPAPPLDAGRDPDGPCQFMGRAGCTLPRWTRAFKCTWYFCEPLLAALDEGEPRKARRLSAALQEMVDWYNGENDGAGGEIDEFVKSLNTAYSVIPVQTGIQSLQTYTRPLDTRFREYDDFLRDHQD